MVIHWSTAYSEDADEAAEEGQFDQAAELRAQSAQSRLERFGIESNASADLAVGDLLYGRGKRQGFSRGSLTPAVDPGELRAPRRW